MQINHLQRLDIAVSDGEIETLKIILALAIDRLKTSPARQLSGSPHRAQAGVKGAELFNAKKMITEMAAALGMGEPDLEPLTEPSSTACSNIHDRALKSVFDLIIADLIFPSKLKP